MYKYKIGTLIATTAILVATGIAAQAETLRLSHNSGEATTWHRGAERFNEILSEMSGGETDVRVFPNAQLSGGDQNRQVEMVSRGALDLVLTSAINVTPIIEEMAVFSLPYLFTDYAEVDAALTGAAGKRMEEIMQEHGIKVLAWGENGFRQVTNSIRPITKPEDMAGLKMRVAGPMYIDVMNALGANPQQMQWTETMSALQQGVIDGQENPVGAVLVPQRMFEVQDYVTIWNYSYDPLFLGVSLELWESWDADKQSTVEAAAEEAMAYQVQITRDDTASGVDLLREEGMEVYEPSAEEIDAFRQATVSAYKTWSERVGSELVGIFEQTVAESQGN